MTWPNIRYPIYLGQVVQSPVKLTQKFWFQFYNFVVRFSLFTVCPSVLNLYDLKVHKT